MTVVVTGAAGFIGSHLVEALAARGERVVAIDRRPDMPATAAIRIVADLVDAPAGAVDDALREAEAVFHLAARAGVRYPYRDPLRHRAAGWAGQAGLDWLRHRDNVLAAERVLQRVPDHVPVVVTSSSAVYGGSRHGRACHEHDPLRPRGGYARSKVAMEARCQARAARGGLVAVARPFTVAGERQRPDMAIAQWIQAVRAGRPIRILGAPERTRDVTDVRDVVTGLLRLADRGVHGTVNLGTGEGHRLATIARAIAAALGRPADLVVEAADREDVPHTLADTRRCQTLLGMTPRTNLDALVRRQVAARASTPGRSWRSLTDTTLARCHPGAIGCDPRGTANAPAIEGTEPLELNASNTTVGPHLRARR
jgi:nucleoside-diphosphate-sugar epimerase